MDAETEEQVASADLRVLFPRLDGSGAAPQCHQSTHTLWVGRKWTTQTQLGEETDPEDVVMRSHAVDRQHRALRVCIGQDPYFFGELPPFVSPDDWSVEVHAFISDGAAGPDGSDSQRYFACAQ